MLPLLVLFYYYDCRCSRPPLRLNTVATILLVGGGARGGERAAAVGPEAVLLQDLRAERASDLPLLGAVHHARPRVRVEQGHVRVVLLVQFRATASNKGRSFHSFIIS